MKKIPWGKYKKIINNFNDENNLQPIIWRRYSGRLNRHGEDNDKEEYAAEIVLMGLIQYNDFRTWPISNFQLTGALDKQSEVLILNRNYLKSNNLLDEAGKFTYNPAKDRFIHGGEEYEDAGHTDTAQALDDPLLLYIILKRTNGTDRQVIEISQG